MVKFELAMFRGAGSSNTYTGSTYYPDLPVEALNHYTNFTHVIFSMRGATLDEVCSNYMCTVMRRYFIF